MTDSQYIVSWFLDHPADRNCIVISGNPQFGMQVSSNQDVFNLSKDEWFHFLAAAAIGGKIMGH